MKQERTNEHSTLNIDYKKMGQSMGQCKCYFGWKWNKV
jgi:hypothetical protein